MTRADYPRLIAHAELEPALQGRLVRMMMAEGMADVLERRLPDPTGWVESANLRASPDAQDMGELMYQDATRPHTAAQAVAEEVFPRTVTQIWTVLQGIASGRAPWRPKHCATDDLLTEEHIACRDPDLHDAAARIALATRLASVIASAGARCGLELFDQAWATAKPGTRPNWQALSVRIQERLATTPLADLNAAVAHAVETRAWGQDPLVSDIAHAIAQDVARLPALQVTAVLVAALKRMPTTEICQ